MHLPLSPKEEIIIVLFILPLINFWNYKPSPFFSKSKYLLFWSIQIKKTKVLFNASSLWVSGIRRENVILNCFGIKPRDKNEFYQLTQDYLYIMIFKEENDTVKLI